MRSFLWSLPLLVATTTASAAPVGVTLEGGGVYGAFGQGSDQEASCSSGATCSSRQKPRGLVFGLEGDYEVAPRLRVSVGLGTVAWKTSVARRFVTSGEIAATGITVQATDQTDFHAYLLTVGAHVDLLTRPVVIRAGVRLGGLLGGEATLTRGGTAECLRAGATLDAPLVPTGENNCATVVTKGAPTDRPMKSVEETASVGFTFVMIPEVRVAVPIGSVLEVGLGLGALVGFADVTPKALRTTPVNGPDDYVLDSSGAKVYGQPVTPEGKVIGFVTSREQWIGQFVIPRGVLFVRASF